MTDSKVGKENNKAVYCHPVYLTYMQNKWKWKLLNHVLLFGILWAVACKTPLSMEFSRQE